MAEIEHADRPAGDHPLTKLDDAEREFVLRLVLASGSLKEMAKQYGVSYPTIRGRLDRLIERLRAIVENRPADPMAHLLGDLVESEGLSAGAARRILDVHRKSLTNHSSSEKGAPEP